MKNLLSIFAIFAAFTFGAVLGQATGIDPILSGVGVTTTYAVISTNSSSFALSGFDFSNLNAQLGAYMRKFDKAIQLMLFNDIQLEKYTRKMSGVSDEWAMASSEIDEILQPFQDAYTPKGTVSVNARINKVRQIKLDFDLTKIDDLYRTYLAFMAVEGRKRSEWPFVRFIVQNHIIPKVKEEIDYNSYNGVYAAPTPGTAGASIDTVDGFGTIIASEITAGNIIPIATGTITATNIVDRVEFFVDSLPFKYQNMAEAILMSPSNARKYERDYRNTFGTNANYNGKDNLKVDATNKMIIGINSMEGSDRIIHTPKANMVTLFDKVYTPNNLQSEQEKRQIHIMGDFKRGYGFADLNKVFVNDQA